MSILYVGHYRESSGWGQVARDYILALDSVGVDVVPRSIDLGLANFDIPNRIKELEQRDPTKCDIIIQHVLPHYMKYDSHFKKNIGLFELETQNIGHTQWVNHLNLMDELWVPCSDMEMIEGVNTPIKVVPHTFEMQQYTMVRPVMDIPQLKNKFVFYFIGEFSVRKHIASMLRAFHAEFSIEEPVEIVLKVNKNGLNTQELVNELSQFCNKIKENLRIYPSLDIYKPEVIITNTLSREDILRLHKTCNCFVCSSHGEAWCIPAFEAMALGNIVISSNTGGPKDYIDANRNGMLVKGSMEPVFGQHEAMPGFGTSREKWFNISVSDLMKTMRRAYEMSPEKKNRMKTEAQMSACKYSYEQIGKQMKELLNV